jgi:hypothetical protein
MRAGLAGRPDDCILFYTGSLIDPLFLLLVAGYGAVSPLLHIPINRAHSTFIRYVMSDLLYLIRMLTAPGGTTFVVYFLLIPYLTYPPNPLTLLTPTPRPSLPSFHSIPFHYAHPVSRSLQSRSALSQS